jgi:hypothetical protein
VREFTPQGVAGRVGVEEPTGIGDQRQQFAGDVGAHRLEAALGIGETGAECGAQQHVVTAGDELTFALRTTRDDGANREPIARSECPEITGATRGISADSSVERSTSM